MPEFPLEVGETILYDAGEGTDRWEVVAVYGDHVELRDAYGASTTLYFGESDA